ncbi:MAG: DinB family protein [Chloroflexota bacterium]
MDTITFVRHQVGAVRRLHDAVVEGLADEHLRWQPPGTANQVGVTWLHLLTTEDSFMQRVMQGGERLWDTGGWEARLSAIVPARGKSWDDVVRSALRVEDLLAYSAAVRAATDRYLDALTPADLDREYLFNGEMTAGGIVLTRYVSHTIGHVGEIAALKGVQGIKGLPF